MIEHINERLVRWADWAAGGRVASGLGYSPCTLIRWQPRCTFARAETPDINVEAGETEKAVGVLPEELRRVVIVFYLGSGSVRQKSRDCGVCRDTFYSRLHQAHERLEVAFRSVAEKKDRRWPVRSSF